MDFLILRPLSPETGHPFFEGMGGGRGVKSLCSERLETNEAGSQLTGGIRIADLQTASRARYRSTTIRINMYGRPTACS